MIDLAQDSRDSIARHLAGLGWIERGRSITSLEKPGEGNMNVTRRARFDDGGTMILKQSVPYVARYPEIAAPEERTEFEAAFYRATAASPRVSNLQPDLVGHDPGSRLIALEDLGTAADYTDCYASRRLDDASIATLVGYLDALHGIEAKGELFRNPSMRQLNHAHLFLVPLQVANGLDLDAVTPGLGGVAATFVADRGLVAGAHALGEIYLGKSSNPTPRLLHGDFFPGSWLRHEETVTKIIDPEFGFVGRPEIDLGVFVAHARFIGRSTDQALAALDGYRRPFDGTLVLAFAGIELIRRLIGVAQLPLVRRLDEKRDLLRDGADWVRAVDA